MIKEHGSNVTRSGMGARAASVTKVTVCKIFQYWLIRQFLFYWKHNALYKVAFLLQNSRVSIDR